MFGFQIPQSLAGATTFGLQGQQAAILQYAQQGPDGQIYIPGTRFLLSVPSFCYKSLQVLCLLDRLHIARAAASALQQVAAYQVAGANSVAPSFIVAATQPTVQLQTNASQSQVQVLTEFTCIHIMYRALRICTGFNKRNKEAFS